jgi:hypothetical protein
MARPTTTQNHGGVRTLGRARVLQGTRTRANREVLMGETGEEVEPQLHRQAAAVGLAGDGQASRRRHIARGACARACVLEREE